MKHKYISDHWIEEYECGIFQLMFNTHQRWIPYHSYNDIEYIFGEEVENESIEDYKSRYYKVEDFLPEGISYLTTVLQNKDQISFYFIPFSLISRDARSRVTKRIKTEKL